jgi:arabinose-5-phosphate isomerase
MNATYGLLLPDVDEACPHGTAPTSSTTMMLALGDALAVGAMRARGTTLDDIARLHPAGSIGNRLSPVETLLRPRARVPHVSAGASMSDAVVEMTSAGRGAVCVLDDDGSLIGIITDGDIRRSIGAIQTARCIDIMTREPLVVREGVSREDAYHVMHDNRVNVIVVVAHDDPRRPLGMVHIHDIELIA